MIKCDRLWMLLWTKLREHRKKGTTYITQPEHMSAWLMKNRNVRQTKDEDHDKLRLK